MEVKATVKHLKMSPRKVRLVVDLVRGLEINKALSQLKFSQKIATKPLAKLIDSAVANAVHNYELEKDNLFIKTIRVDEGKTLHRWTPKAHGRATPIRKRSSHIHITLAEIKDSGNKEAKKQTVEEPVKLSSLLKQDGGKKTEEKVTAETKKKETGKSAKSVTNSKVENIGDYTKHEGGNESQGFIKKVFQRKSGQ